MVADSNSSGLRIFMKNYRTLVLFTLGYFAYFSVVGMLLVQCVSYFIAKVMTLITPHHHHLMCLRSISGVVHHSSSIENTQDFYFRRMPVHNTSIQYRKGARGTGSRLQKQHRAVYITFKGDRKPPKTC